MNILLTNDDGIDSEGLLSLKKALSELGKIQIIAPSHNWSAAGHNKTMYRPLRVRPTQLRDGGTGYVTDGTPSDCVTLAALGFLETKPDLVVSGINKGPNLGDDITYSGTVAAAIEGIISGIPSFAISLNGFTDYHFETAAAFAAKVVKNILTHKIGTNFLLNINVPNLPPEQIKGVAITKLGKRIYQDELIEREDPWGHPYYWIGGEPPSALVEPGTDFEAIAEDKISVTPIELDLTHFKLIKELEGWEW